MTLQTLTFEHSSRNRNIAFLINFNQTQLPQNMVHLGEVMYEIISLRAVAWLNSRGAVSY